MSYKQFFGKKVDELANALGVKGRLVSWNDLLAKVRELKAKADEQVQSDV